MTTSTNGQSPSVADVLKSVRVGSAIGEAAVMAVEDHGADPGTLLLRIGVMEVLAAQLDQIVASGIVEDDLLRAYRRWVEVSVDYMGSEPTTTARDYAHASALLTAELHLALGGGVPEGGRGAVQYAPMGES